jgi:hypothetical protein
MQNQVIELLDNEISEIVGGSGAGAVGAGAAGAVAGGAAAAIAGTALAPGLITGAIIGWSAYEVEEAAEEGYGAAVAVWQAYF